MAGVEHPQLRRQLRRHVDALVSLRRAGVTGRCWSGRPRPTTSRVGRGDRRGSLPVLNRCTASTRGSAHAIATIDGTAWTPIVYPNAITDPDTGELISSGRSRLHGVHPAWDHGAGHRSVDRAQGAGTQHHEAGRDRPGWPVRRVALPRGIHQPDDTPGRGREDPPWPLGHRAGTRRSRAGPRAHLPSKSFNANAEWLAIATMAFNFTRAVGVTAGGRYGRARDRAIRAQLIHTRAGRHRRPPGTPQPAHPLALGGELASTRALGHDYLTHTAPDRYDQGAQW